MATKSSTIHVGMGLPTLLGVAFIVLKLCGVIAWSWWWVLSPFWIPWVIVLGVLFAGLLLMGVTVALVRR